MIVIALNISVLPLRPKEAVVTHESYRYFIELRPSTPETASRLHAQEERRRHALAFIHDLREWLDENSLQDKVQTLDVTVFGQVHITCEPDVIDFVREHDDSQIAVIRPASVFHEGVRRLMTESATALRQTA